MSSTSHAELLTLLRYRYIAGTARSAIAYVPFMIIPLNPNSTYFELL